MILVFGGTTEGKQVIELLTTAEISFVYSTKTKIKLADTSYMKYRFGALEVQELKAFIEQNGIDLIINAAHPFATSLHDTIQLSQGNIPVIRLERTYPKRTKHALVKYVHNYTEALKVLRQYENKRLLALSGVQSIPQLVSFWSQNPTYFRILNRSVSLAIAEQNNFPSHQLILGLSDQSLSTEVKTIEGYEIGVVLTKESGVSGGLSVKIEAALACKIPIIIIEKPVLPDSFHMVDTVKELEKVVGLRLKMKV